MEVQRAAADGMADEAKEELQKAAFIGWQNYLFQPDMSAKPKKKMGFGEYQKKMGLSEKGHAPAQMSVEEAVKVAEETDAMVREAFRRTKPAQA